MKRTLAQGMLAELFQNNLDYLNNYLNERQSQVFTSQVAELTTMQLSMLDTSETENAMDSGGAHNVLQNCFPDGRQVMNGLING